jgi:FolB domain-containing protein
MAIIHVKNLKIKTIIGINRIERVEKQVVKISFWLTVDISEPGISDDIKHCVDYRTVTKKIINFVKNSSYFTLEKLTAEVLNILTHTKGVQNARVTVSKPGALRNTEDVSITESL